MKLVALTPVRNESWVLGASLRSTLLWCDHVVVLNHASNDNTAGIIYDVSEEFPGKVTALSEPDPVWKEMDHRQRLLRIGREIGGTHFALVDADGDPNRESGSYGAVLDFQSQSLRDNASRDAGNVALARPLPRRV